MVWIEVLLAVLAGAVLGGLLLAGRTVAPGSTTVVVWLLLALGGVAAAALLASEPVVVVAVALPVAFVVIGLGAPWAAARADPHLRAVPYWSRLRGDARLRADAVRRDAREAHVAPERRDLSTPDA